MLGGWLGFRSWVNRSYFVGVEGGRVAIFRGLPTEVVGVELNHVEERFSIPLDAVPEVFRRRLQEGIRKGSLEEAREVVSAIRSAGSASPSPSPTPTKT